MRLLVSILAALVIPGFCNAEPSAPAVTLREHMHAMGYIFDDIFAKSEDATKYSVAADRTRELRMHMVQAISLIPSKFEVMNEFEKRQHLLEFHQLLARAIYLTATLELAFTGGPDFMPTSMDQAGDIRNLLHEISVVMGKAHGQFR